MALLTSTRVAQNILSAEFAWTYADTMANTSDTVVDFGITTITSANTFVAIKLPPNSVVVGGMLNRTVAFDTAGYTMTVGDSTTAARYMASADVKAVGTTALLTPGFRNPTGLDIRITITNTDVCTTGTAYLTVFYIIENRANEVTSGTV